MNSPGITTMICNLIRLIVLVQLLAICSTKCDAAVIHTFNLTNLGPPGTAGSLGSTFNLNSPTLNDGGILFTATLVVTGSGNIEFNSSAAGGIGVNGNTLNGPSGQESLRFSIQLSNIVGGSVGFNGFTIIGFSNFSTGDGAVLSIDDSFLTSGDNTSISSGGLLPSVAVTGNPSSFSIFSNASTSNHFSVASVTGSFTGTAAVPEPSAFVAMVIVSSALPLFRRFRRRENSVDSKSLVV
jgi:hypothetical protein